jgi:hypothetical protein
MGWAASSAHLSSGSGVTDFHAAEWVLRGGRRGHGVQAELAGSVQAGEDLGAPGQGVAGASLHYGARLAGPKWRGEAGMVP